MSGKRKFRILIADDEAALRSLLCEILAEDHVQLEEAVDGLEALAKLQSGPFDLMFLDIKMPRRDGLGVLEEIRSRGDLRSPGMPRVVVITAFGDFDIALEAMRLGAYEYVNKPFDIAEIKALADKVESLRELEEEADVVRATLSEEKLGERIVGRSEKMLEIIKTIGRIADSPVTVLLTGESGTGKELVARTLHRASQRGGKLFLPVNCAAIPETLLESELFGYEKGAFTGAQARTLGKFEAAQGGTLLLDEIGDMSLSLQAKLLRVLQDHTFMRVGGKESIQVDVRVIAATNQDIEAMVKEGRFREDLYYRLNVLTLAIPPLRARREDIHDLTLYFLAKYARDYGKPVQGISKEALQHLWSHPWPGNVRELENAVARAVAQSTGTILLPEEFELATPEKEEEEESSPVIVPLSVATAKLEQRLIKDALQVSGGNQSQAARLLQISRQTLATKMKEYGIQ
ncbi:MAG: sigma-54 dependent transcriptional regulator [Coprothermobacterota bacterium]|nr:sigma-54 dependent transcriptional regulator [Coprothermobacterota bacterium]